MGEFLLEEDLQEGLYHRIARVLHGEFLTAGSGIAPKPSFAVMGSSGVGLAALDLAGDGRADILTSPGYLSGKLKLFDGTGKPAAGLGSIAVPAGSAIAGFAVSENK